MCPIGWKPVTSRLEELIAEEQAKIDAIQSKQQWQIEPLPTIPKVGMNIPQIEQPLSRPSFMPSEYIPPHLPTNDEVQTIQTRLQRGTMATPTLAPTSPVTPITVPTIPDGRTQWWEQPAVIGEKVMEAVGQGISKVPILPKVLQFAAPAFEFIHEKLEKPFASVITAPFSPSLSWKSGESWLEHEKREYNAWKAPTYVKGLAEFAMPLWWMPWFSWAKVAAKPLVGAGKAARMASILPKQPFEALLPTYKQLEAFIPNNIVKRAVLKLEDTPVLKQMIKVVGGEAAFTRRNPITAVDKARNYAVFWGQHRDIGENIVRTKMNDLTVKRIVQEVDKQVFKSEDNLFKFVDQEMFKGQRVNANISSVTTDATHPGVVIGGRTIPRPKITPITPKVTKTNLDNMTQGLSKLRNDTARLKGSAKSTMLELESYYKEIENYFNKWLPDKKNQLLASRQSLDAGDKSQFIIDAEALLSQGHLVVDAYKSMLASPKAEAYIEGRVSYAMDDVWQNPNLYKWTDKAAEAYVKEGHDIVGWMMNWATANGVKLPSQKRGLKVVGEIIQQHIPRVAKAVEKEGLVTGFKRTDPFREMIYETMREGVEAGVKYGGTFADRVNLMSRSIATRVAQNKFDNAVKPLGKTLLERLEGLEPEIVGKFTAQANRVDALKRALVSLQKNKPIHYATMRILKEEFPDLVKAMEGITAITPQVASDYIRAMAKSSTLILEKNREPLISELLSTYNFYDVIQVVGKYTKSESSAVRLASAWYKHQLKARATEYRELLQNIKNNVLVTEKKTLVTHSAEVAKLKRSLRVPKIEKLEARFHNHPAFNNRIFPTEVVRVLDPVLGDRGKEWIRNLAQVSGLSRMVTATLDLSAPFIQGTALFGRNPVAWAKNTYKMMEIAARPQNLYLELAKRKGSLMERAVNGGSTTAIDYFEAMPALRGIAARVSGGQRVVVETFGRAEAAWLGFGELARDEMWQAGKWQIAQRELAKDVMEGQMRELAHSLDLMTGVMSPQAIGIPLTQQQVESAFVFFAPRYTRAGLSFAGNVLQGGLAGAEARKALAGFMLGGLTMYKGATSVLGQEMNLDPNSGRFMTIKVGDTYIGVGGIYYALMRLSADIATTSVEDPLAMLPTNLSRTDNPFYKFMYNRTSPLTGLTFGLAIEHKNFLGEPFENVGDYAAFMADKVLPFSVASQMPWEKEPWQDGAFQPAELGAQLAGLRAFPESSWEARKNYRDNLAQSKYQRNWEQLNRVEQRDIEQDYPILEKFDEYVSHQQARRGEIKDVLWSRWQDEIDSTQEQRDELISRAAIMAEQDRDYYTFRLRVRDIENDYAAVMTSINGNKEYTPIMETLKIPKTLEQLSSMDRKEMAYNIWAQFRYSQQTTPFGLMQNEIGEPIWENIEKLRDWVRQQFGEEALNYIEQERPLAGRDLPPMYLELQQAEQVMKPYWAVADTVARLFGQRYADSNAGQSLISKRRKQMRLTNRAIAAAYNKFYASQ